jgi:hypothetical protein
MTSIPVLSPSQLTPPGAEDTASGMLAAKLRAALIANQQQQNILRMQPQMQMQDLQKAILANQYQKLQNQFYGPSTQAEIGLKGAQAGLAGAQAGLAGAQTPGAAADSAINQIIYNRIRAAQQNTTAQNMPGAPAQQDSGSGNPSVVTNGAANTSWNVQPGSNVASPPAGQPMLPANAAVSTALAAKLGQGNSQAAAIPASFNSQIANALGGGNANQQDNDADMRSYLSKNSQLYNKTQESNKLLDPNNAMVQTMLASKNAGMNVPQSLAALDAKYPGAADELKTTTEIQDEAQKQIPSLNNMKMLLEAYKEVATNTPGWQFNPAVKYIAQKYGLPMSSNLQILQGISTLLPIESKNMLGMGAGYSKSQQELARLQAALGDPHNLLKPAGLALTNVASNMVDNASRRNQAISDAIGKYGTYRAIKYPGFDPDSVKESVNPYLNSSGKAPSEAGLVAVKTADGKIWHVPAEKLDMALSRGAKRIG